MALAKENTGGQTQDITPFVTPPPTPTVNPGGPNAEATPDNPYAGIDTKASGDTSGAGTDPNLNYTPGPDTITTSPGYDPNYQSLIQSDPGYQQAQTNNQQSGANAAAARRAQIQAYVIKYGGLPPGFKDAYGDVDQATLDAASKNQFSTIATLHKNYQTSQDQFRRALAARGALQSGDLNYGQDQMDTGYGQNLYDAGDAFGNQAVGAVNQYTGVLDQNQRDLVGALQGAASNAESSPAGQPVKATTAQRDAAKSSLYGQDIYTGADGTTLYTRDGSVFDPNAWYASITAPQYDPNNPTVNAHRPGVQM